MFDGEHPAEPGYAFGQPTTHPRIPVEPEQLLKAWPALWTQHAAPGNNEPCLSIENGQVTNVSYDRLVNSVGSKTASRAGQTVSIERHKVDVDLLAVGSFHGVGTCHPIAFPSSDNCDSIQ